MAKKKPKDFRRLPVEEAKPVYANKYMTATQAAELIKEHGYKVIVKDNMPIVAAKIENAEDIVRFVREIGYMGSLGLDDTVA